MPPPYFQTVLRLWLLVFCHLIEFLSTNLNWAIWHTSRNQWMHFALYFEGPSINDVKRSYYLFEPSISHVTSFLQPKFVMIKTVFCKIFAWVIFQYFSADIQKNYPSKYYAKHLYTCITMNTILAKYIMLFLNLWPLLTPPPLEEMET